MNNSATLGYKLPTFTGLISHSWASVGFLRDTADEHKTDAVAEQEVDVQVRSGDYFVTLATDLDRLSGKVTNHSTRLEIEDVISDLIYLQDHYTISKKRSPAVRR
jgi:hypothetical protein